MTARHCESVSKFDVCIANSCVLVSTDARWKLAVDKPVIVSARSVTRIMYKTVDISISSFTE